MAVDINGDGLIALGGTSTTQGRLRLAEDTDNGTNYIELTAPASVASNRTITLPDNTGTILTSATTTGFPAGSVIQVVQATNDTLVTTTSGSYVTTNLTASITPSNSSNKILILCNTHASSANSSSSAIFTIFRGTVSGTDLGSGEGFGSVYSGAGSARGIIAIHYLDSPSTTSSQAYTLGFKAGAAGNTQSAQLSNTRAVMVLMEIAA